MVDSWWQLRRGAQAWYEPSLPSLSHPPVPSPPVSPDFPLTSLSPNLIKPQPLDPSFAEGIQAVLGTEGKRGSEAPGRANEPVGRRELLDASLQAQKVQAMLQELLVWAQRLRAEMDARSAPSSPSEARRMLEEHQEHKVRAGTLGPFRSSHLLPAFSLIWSQLWAGSFPCCLPLPFSSITPSQLCLLPTGPPPGLKAPDSGI